MVMAQTAGGAIKRPGKSHSISKVAPKSQIESSTNKKEPTSHQNKSKALTGYTNGHAWVDLGLPSGTLWATMNVGASKPEEYGDYFAWGETEPKSYYSWETYRWCNGSDSTLTKYCAKSEYAYKGITDKKEKLDQVDDAAYVNWGNAWCIPSIDQFTELMDEKYATKVWSTQNGVNGRQIISKKNGNSIFLPASGLCFDRTVAGRGILCGYWNSTYPSFFPPYADGVFFDSNDVQITSSRCYGFSIRPVTKKNMRYSQEDNR